MKSASALATLAEEHSVGESGWLTNPIKRKSYPGMISKKFETKIIILKLTELFVETFVTVSCALVLIELAMVVVLVMP